MTATSTQVLLGKIAALRQRLAQGETQEAGAEGIAASTAAASTAAASTAAADTAADPAKALERKVAVGSWHNSLFECLRDESASPTPSEEPKPAFRLTARSARLLQQGRSLLHELRKLADEPLLEKNPLEPLSKLHRDTAAMIDSVLRGVQTFPESASAQVRLCDGLEAMLAVMAERIGTLRAGIEHRRRQHAQIDTLADLLQTLARGQSLSVHAFQPLAEELLEEARQGQRLRFVHAGPETPVRFCACHGLVTAQVMARLVWHDAEWAGRAHEPVMAALLHDIGMQDIPAEIIALPGPLNDEQRRAVEGHTTAGADMLRRLVPAKSWLVDAAAAHHERLDGTGYPAGLRDGNLSNLIRLLTVCDVYAALCTPRPYRTALETRTALTDTLLFAEQGALDQFQAERLLDLAFYPVGSVVELTDGAIGVVVATHPAKKDLRAPARPVLSMLVDSQGRFLPLPTDLDLLQSEGHSILRALPAEERQELLGMRYPELV